MTLLTQKQDGEHSALSTRFDDLNERVEEAGRCIELLKESVESLEDFLEKGLQSVMDKCGELEQASQSQAADIEKLKEDVLGIQQEASAAASLSKEEQER